MKTIQVAAVELDEYINKIRQLPNLVKEAAPGIAEALESELERQIRAGTDPNGKPWQERLDGGQPLETAADSLAVVVVRKSVIAKIRGHVARHNNGTARGGIVRQILPTKMTPKIAIVVDKVVIETFDRIISG